MRTRIDVDEPDDREPEELAVWVAAGFTAGTAEVWRRWRFTIARARTWVAAGVDEGLEAAQWATAGVTPGTVEEWRQAGIGPGEAVRWHEFGFGLAAARDEKGRGNGPDAAFARAHPQTQHGPMARVRGLAGSRSGNPLRGLHEAGVDPRLIRSYMEHQWMDESAVAWATQGIDAVDAYMWHGLGLTAAEA
jgi:hypothetical protein